MNIDGAILVGDEDRQGSDRFQAFYPESETRSSQSFSEAQAADVADACALAKQAAVIFGATTPDARAAFLEAVAEQILAIGDVLIETAKAETGLPQPRLEGERMRTVNQLRMFADEVRKGAWLDVTIDAALPDRQPPRSDLRRMNVALGPVAVFGASNFPLAFSVAGGDTASAFAAGCPVVVKGHPAHPGTGELVARAVREAVRASGLPQGVFSYLPGLAHELGAALVGDDRIEAVGFTGSRAGGLALMSVAAARHRPIPVYAEMSCINPVVLMPHALEMRAGEIAGQFATSLTLGSGQFCTNPGLLIAIESTGLDSFRSATAQSLQDIPPSVMLTPGIHAAYGEGMAALASSEGVKTIASGPQPEGSCQGRSVLFEVSAETFRANPRLQDEVFGASSLLVTCRDLGELLQVLERLEGQLTATIHCDAEDIEHAQAVMPVLVEKAGRVLANGWPTGVEVTAAMVHGGPFPATSCAASTSVGTLAMMRFLRPVCFQDIPAALLPAVLRT